MATLAGQQREIANRYATALFELGMADGNLSDLKQEAQALKKLVEDSQDIQNMLSNPLFDADEQLAAMTAIVNQAGFSTPIKNFAKVIIEHGRGPIITSICGRFIDQINDHQGIVHIDATSAKPMTDKQTDDLIEAMKSAGKSQVTVKNSIDSSILSGLILQIGSTIMDDSGRSKLNRLQSDLEKAA